MRTADGTVLGVDLGIENLAVTSTASFFSGRELTHDLREFENCDVEWRIYHPPGRVRGRVHGQAPPSTSEPVRV